MSGRGSVYSDTEVRHAMQPAFKPHLPYAALLVELDEQRGQPSEPEALRLISNLTTPAGALAPAEMVCAIGIGARVRVVFAASATAFSITPLACD